jgi:hypothetical protein
MGISPQAKSIPSISDQFQDWRSQTRQELSTPEQKRILDLIKSTEINAEENKMTTKVDRFKSVTFIHAERGEVCTASKNVQM